MSRTTYFRTCEFCGSNLDPGERCDCQTAQETLRIIFPTRSEKVSVRAEKPLRKAEKAS